MTKLKKIKNKFYVIFTDLDGTLLDNDYSYKDVLPVLKILKKRKVPVIFCSAKTRAEQEFFQKKMGINHPFIVENGSAIYIPNKYFKRERGKKIGNYRVIVLDDKSDKIRKEIKKLQKKYKIKAFYDITEKEISRIAGFGLKKARLAKLAKIREFGETIVEANKQALKELKKKFNVVSGGRFIQVFGKKADKGKAVRILTQMYKNEFGGVTTIGIGNSENDKPMLKNVDAPVLVEHGPKDWAEFIKKFVLKYDR
ncbi:HAD-IIB family hydrolase [Candidatus Parcubacteria bacterium]|nr:HAD-IIB family hydrolase [Candidatus Parcubacteria bacterium]